MRRIMLAILAVAALSSAAVGGPAGDILSQTLYSGTLADGLSKLEPMAAGGDTEAAFGVGAVKLTRTLEHFVQTLYRHGFSFPSTRSVLGPNLLVQVPQTANPEPFDYAGVRAMLQDFVSGLDEARASFETAGKRGDYVIEINPLKVLVDANDDGKAEPSESLAALIALWTSQRMEDILDPKNFDKPRFETIGFDRADAFWLAGYSEVFAAQADFLLAHDFSDFVNAVFHRLFPRAGFPMQDYARGGTLVFEPETDTGIADIVAAIHSISWPVIEPDRLKGVLARMKTVVAYSRQNWDAILAETDDNHELLPSPKQTSIDPDVSITDEKVAAWRATLDEADKILDGELHIPHWRFRQGFDLKAYLETATRTDLVMILTGAGAVPFLRDGPVASAADFRAIQAAFGNEWLGYAFWFN